MMIYHRQNFSAELPKANDGDVFVECNFAQRIPGTKILAGVKGLSFVRCNLTRAVIPDDAETDGCNTSQDPFVPKPAPEQQYNIRESLLIALVDNAEVGGMDVTAIREEYGLEA